MWTVVDCITRDHDATLLLLAAIVCVLGSVVTLRLFGVAVKSRGTAKAAWVFMTSVSCAATIWTTHFIAMLGYQSPGTAGYDPVTTIASLFVALGFSLVGVALASFASRPLLVEGGGFVIGFGVAVMHMTGMSGYEVNGYLLWDPAFVAASTFVGVLIGMIAMKAAVAGRSHVRTVFAPLLLVLAICGMHFTAMAAVTIEIDPAIAAADRLMENDTIGYFAFAMVLLILGGGGCMYLADMRSTREQMERLNRLAEIDSLTDLPNRRALSKLATSELGRAAADGRRLALLALDFDRFKDVNDTHGHGAGDELLKTVAGRFRAVLRPGEFLARVGGDEFVATTTAWQDEKDVGEFARRLVEAVVIPVDLGTIRVRVGASVGVATVGDEHDDLDSLLTKADLALYRSKEDPNSKISFYDRRMDEAHRTRLAMAGELRTAVENHELELHYQPQFRVSDGTLCGFEALIRWNHPRHGAISPGDFVPVAEATGLIVPIGDWAMASACATAATWPTPVKVAVNVAPAQLLHGNFVATVRNVLWSTGLPAERLEIEITETTIVSDEEVALTVVSELQSMGVTIAMDDYGTGYSSLSMLRTFPFDKIKIDRSFVDDVVENPQSAAIVKATLILAKSLGIPVVAEGVETEEQMAFLRREGCEEAQGFFLGAPRTTTGMQEFFQEEDHGSAIRSVNAAA